MGRKHGKRADRAKNDRRGGKKNGKGTQGSPWKTPKGDSGGDWKAREAAGFDREKDREPTREAAVKPREFKRERSSASAGHGTGPSGDGGGGFQFRDRSGKVHTPGSNRKGPAGPGPRGGFQPETPTTRARDFAGGPEQVYRPRPESEVVARAKPASARGGQRPNREHEDRPRPARRGGRGGSELIRLKASVDKNRKGFAFLGFENRQYEDAFVPPREAQELFHGDRVEVTISEDGQVHQIRVLQHRFRELTGRYMPHASTTMRGGWVVYERKKAREQVFVPDLSGLKGPRPEEGDWVRAKLNFHSAQSEQAGQSGTSREPHLQHPVTAEIVEVYGKDLPPSADVGMIANEYSLIEEHPEASEQEAREKKLEIPGRDLEGREDLREVPFITIDGETARDFDDAIYVERKGKGYVLWVAIADVSHYVSKGSALDNDAYSRATSVYFPERAFHMLPRALSENLCSLRPNEPRLTMVARMEYNSEGLRQSTEIMEAVIQSKRRATYNEIQKEWEANQTNASWEFTPHFDLYKLIRKQRADRGSIDFDLPEAELLVEKTGEVISIKNRARMDAHRLIEEFMISANEAVTQWALERRWPFVYRVHDVPAMQSLEKFQALAANVGVSFSIGDASPRVMADLIKKLEGHPAAELLNTALLRSMKQAAYSAIHGIHFGLASEGYTHFTSPIRRYPDLLVHRVLRQALRVEKGLLRKPSPDELKKLEDDLAEACEHCSYRERLASDAERESIKLKQTRLMMRHLGDEFDGKINGMTENGMFAQLDDPFVEGMIHRDRLADDFYQFDDQHMIFFGKRKRRTFKMGDRVKVRVARADLDLRIVDFDLLEGGATAAEAHRMSSGPAPRGRGRDREDRPQRGDKNRMPGNRNQKGKRRGR